MCERNREALDSLQAISVSTHRNGVEPQWESAEAEGKSHATISYMRLLRARTSSNL